MKKTLLLAAAAFATAAIPVAVSALPPAQAWEIGPWVRGRNYSVGMPANPSPVAGGVAFEFPVAGRGQIDAMTTGVGSLSGARTITLRYRIDARPGTRFIAVERPGETAAVSLYIQQAGDNWSGRGRYEGYRWYVPVQKVMALSPGEHTVTIGFNEPWISVEGKTNAQWPEAYGAALANASRIGIAFGSAGLRSHGVYATAPARFTLIALDIR